MTRREVPVQGLQEAFRRSGMTKSEVCKALGWIRCSPDTDRLNRALGLVPDRNGRGDHKEPRQSCSYDRAVRICKAMNANPFDCGV